MSKHPEQPRTRRMGRWALWAALPMLAASIAAQVVPPGRANQPAPAPPPGVLPEAPAPATAPTATPPAAGRPAATQPTTLPAARALPPLTPARLLPTSLPATPGLAALPRMTAARPTTVIPPKGCVTDACHASIKNFKVVHGPVNVNACDSCHKLTDALRHTFEYTRNKTEICTFCHKMDYGSATLIHKPVANGDCLPCHNPHGAPNKRFLRGQTMNDLCASCHRDVAAGRKSVHGPVAAGACGACHAAHASTQPRLLTATGTDLCLTCHADMKTQMEQAVVKHKAVEQDCMNCHDAHASDFAMQTRQAPLPLCTTQCHQDVRKAALEAPHRHGVVTRDQACLYCHTAHGGKLAKLMKAQPIQVCMACHDKPVQDGATKVAAVAEVLDPKMVKHGPIATGSCGGCHNVHGSAQNHLLAKPYPPTFYEAFDVQKYDLCFTCHDKQLATVAKTATLTRFRNGETNLHFLHVNKAKGRTCRACHATHAGPNPMQVRESVPYGSWNMPVRFTPSPTGGTCEAGCHRELAYDRNKPVSPGTMIIPAQGPSAQPRPAGEGGPAAPGTPATAPAGGTPPAGPAAPGTGAAPAGPRPATQPGGAAVERGIDDVNNVFRNR